MAAVEQEDEHGLSLAELAERSGTPARTIRYYQSAGVLFKPSRRGRQAVYGAEHHERLRLIAELQDRGLTLSAIRNLLDHRSRPGLSVAEWLGVDESLRGPWSEDRPRLVDERELGEVTGPRPPGYRRRLEDTGYISRHREGIWLVPSPALLHQALRLQDAGVDVEISARAQALLRRRLARAVDDLIDLFVESAGAGFAGNGSAGDLATALDELRPIARESAGTIFAQEVEAGLRRLLDQGRTPARRSSKRSRRP